MSMVKRTEKQAQPEHSAITQWGLVPNWPAPKSVRAFCSSRFGGVSEGPYASLNLGDHVGDCPDRVATNRKRLRQQVQCPPIQWLKQVHGTQCLQAESLNHREAAVQDSSKAQIEPPIGDALWTRSKQHTLAILTADCMPILMCDRRGTQVCALHAGWRGLAAGIIEQGLNTFSQGLGYQSTEVLIWLGPAIGPTAFEVGPEVKQRFVEQQFEAESAFREIPAHATTGAEQTQTSYLCDLYELAKLRIHRYFDQAPLNQEPLNQEPLNQEPLNQAPFDKNRLTLAGIYTDQFCTVTDKLDTVTDKLGTVADKMGTFKDQERWFSHRRQAPTGRMASLIWLSN